MASMWRVSPSEETSEKWIASGMSANREEEPETEAFMVAYFVEREGNPMHSRNLRIKRKAEEEEEEEQYEEEEEEMDYDDYYDDEEEEEEVF